MTVFLTSSPTGPPGVPCDVPGLDPSNGFVELLKARWPEDARCLMIAAFPGNHDQNDQMTANTGLCPLTHFDFNGCTGIQEIGRSTRLNSSHPSRPRMPSSA